MSSLPLPKEATLLLDQLDLLGLDALIKKLENDLHEDDVRLTSLKKE
ncbi:MAG: hypothetical protein Q7S16_00330 [bacterium]|nr:hypothetical protein [bacterium]